MTDLVIAMIPIDLKFTNFPYTCIYIYIYIYVTGSAKRGLIAFLKFQLQSVVTHSVFSLLIQNYSQK